MKYSILNGIRAPASPKAKGICPLCGADTRAKCGSKIIWHWAHISRKDCDPWWENETDWHRQWKNNYPDEWQEVVLFDTRSGEKHIADIKSDSGLVIEFQNSPMTPEELASREAFYGQMIWVVNGIPFKDRFHVLDPLPDPKSEFAKDLGFFPQRFNMRGRIYYRPSEKVEGSTMVECYSMLGIMEQILKNHVGHYLFDWVRPKSVWFEAKAPIYFDFGEEWLYELCIYDTRGLTCIRKTRKKEFITFTNPLHQQGLSDAVHT